MTKTADNLRRFLSTKELIASFTDQGKFRLVSFQEPLGRAQGELCNRLLLQSLTWAGDVSLVRAATVEYQSRPRALQ